jgi:NAD-dependent SIR2 family protein deacetylase
MKHPG